MTKFIVLRHCEAEQNKTMTFQGRLDGDISSLGEQQLTYLAERFKGEYVDRVISSSRIRAYKTAEAANKYLGLNIEIDDRLIEIDGGDWEGKKFADFSTLFPLEFDKWNHNPQQFVAPNGESMKSVFSRVSELVKELSEKCPNQTIILSSHGCTVRNLWCWFKYGDLSCINNLPWPANTAVFVFETDGTQKRVITENDISHLPEQIQTLSSQNWSK